MIDQVKRKQQDAQHMIYNQIHEKQKNNIDNEKIQIQLKTQTNIKEDQKNLEDEDEGIDGCKNYKNQISKKENEVQEIGAQEYIHSSRSLNSKQKLEYFDEEEEEEEEDYYNEDQDNFNYSEIDEIETIFNGDDEDTDRHTNFTSDISRQFCDFSNDFSSTTSGSSSTFQFQQQQQKSQKQQQYYNFQPTLMQKQLQFKEYSDKIAQFKAQVQKLNAYVKFCEQQIRYFYEKQQNLNLPPNLQIFNSNEKNEQSQLQQNLNISTEDEEKQIFLKNEQFLKLKSKKKNNNISNNNLLILPHLDSNNNNDDAISIISEVDSSSNNTSFYSQQEFAYSPNQQSLRKKQQNCQQSMSLIRKQMQKHDQQNVENQIKQVDKEILRLKQLQCEDLKCKLLQGLSSSSSSTTTTNSIDKNCDDEDDDNSVTGKKQFIKSLSATSNKLSSFSKKIEKPQTINVKSLSQCEEYPKANEKRGRKRKSSQVSTIQHESSSNQSIQLISCRIKGCTFICSKPVVLHKHMKDAHNQVDGIQGEYICTICSQYFHIELSFKRHLKLMHGIQV